MWGVTFRSLFDLLKAEQFQSTLPVWGVTNLGSTSGTAFFISIHTPRVGSDLGTAAMMNEYEISIHTPRVGSDRGTADACGAAV